MAVSLLCLRFISFRFLSIRASISPGDGGPVRCEMCRAYINSFAKYTQNGEKVR